MSTQHMELLTDLYELTMAAVYFQEGMYEPATFSLFIRDYPPNRAYFISAGLEEVLAYLESFRFTRDDLDYLDSTGLFSTDFLHYLHSLRFTGQVRAIPEGRLFFKDEPILEVTAPIIQAQIIESFVINTINLQVLLATKASRCVHAAKGRGLIDFSLRRTQGPDAGLRVARSGYLAGMNGTSNVLAGKMYGIPVSGTMAHSFVTSFPDELEAFRAFARAFPQSTVLLIDTYDTLSGAEKAVRIAREMEEQDLQLRGVRLDSGDMLQLSRQVRDLFNREGLDYVRIFASGGFDEYKIQEMVRQGGMIDAFGVGTKVGVSADAPYTDIAYKLVKYAGHPVLKLSSGKKTLVDEKQVFRTEDNGRPVKDTIALSWEDLDGEPLLKTVMESGKRILQPDSLEDIRERCQQELSRLDERFKALESPDAYPVELSSELVKLQAEVVHKVREKELGES
ncbi:MAG: nicotinate phosphoribosyltransferase [Desulfohalobiaceae bacterium]|nr:nicotinate phosphoribosyltransferase [Desulfohalobiaceae bacterium]